MQDKVSEREIKCLLHFTNYKNLPSIMQNGLLRRSELDERTLPYSFNDTVRLDGHKNSVSLSISFPNYRMFYAARQSEPSEQWVVLFLHPQVLSDKKCAFYPHNAATACFKGTHPAKLGTKEAFDAMFEDVASNTRSKLQIATNYTTDPQAEVLVFEDIEPEYIFGIAAEETKIVSQILEHYTQYTEKTVKHYNAPFGPRSDYKHWQ